jgi:hypothetical protein
VSSKRELRRRGRRRGLIKLPKYDARKRRTLLLTLNNCPRVVSAKL